MPEQLTGKVVGVSMLELIMHQMESSGQVDKTGQTVRRSFGQPAFIVGSEFPSYSVVVLKGCCDCGDTRIMICGVRSYVLSDQL